MALLPANDEGYPERLSVAVVGGGIGGLALALALQQRGVLVGVFERDESFFERAQGYGLTLQQGSSAVRVLLVLQPMRRMRAASLRAISA